MRSRFSGMVSQSWRGGLLLWAFVLVSAPMAAVAQTFSFGSVSVTGNLRIESATILSLAEIPLRQQLTAGQISDAQQRVLNSGFFEEVEFQPRGSQLLINVVERATINVINIEGNRRLEDEVLLGLLASQPRRVYSPAVAEADARTIVQAYADAGRFAATVRPAIIRRPDNRVDLVFEVTEGRVVEIERIGFIGNDAYSDRRLRRVIDSKQAGLLRTIIQRDTFVGDRIPIDRQLLTDFYNARGFIDFRVVDATSEFSRERGATFITFTVEEGRRYRIGDITAVSQLPEVNPAPFRSALRIRQGQVYSPLVIDNEITRLEQLALREGLDFVRVDPVIVRNPASQTVDIEFRIIRGPRIFVQRIDIEGNETTLDRVIRRQFDTVEGDPFNPRAIRNAAERIRALGFFSSVTTESRPGSTGDQVIIDVDVEEQPTGSLTFGAAYSSDAGPAVIAGFSERNFLGRGQSLSFDISLGSSDQTTQVTFVEPAFLGRDVRFSFSAFYEVTRFADATFDTDRIGARTSLRFPISESTNLSLSYRILQANLVNIDADASAIILAEPTSILTSEVGYALSFDSRRRGLDPDRFFVLGFGQDVAGLGGDARFIRTRASAVFQREILQGDVTLRAASEFGALVSFGGYDTRASERYFNNNRKIRGFAPRGIGPRDTEAVNNDVLGGNYEAFVRLDAEFPLPFPEEYGIGGGVFLDVGSIWGLDVTCVSCVTPVDDGFEIRSSVGVALLWDTPIGPLRFNYAIPIASNPLDDVRNFNFDIQARF